MRNPKEISRTFFHCGRSVIEVFTYPQFFSDNDFHLQFLSFSNTWQYFVFLYKERNFFFKR